MLGKVILWVSAVMFVSYGLACFFSPALPAGYAGLEMTNGDAFAEIGAMYGGLQTGVGLLCALAALRSEYYRAGLMLLALGIGALALGRFYSLVTGGNPVGFYTYGALGYEILTAVLAGIALRMSADPATPSSA